MDAKKGLTRSIPGARLVSRIEQPDATYEELWIYNTATLQDDIKRRKEILAGTDIPPGETESPDGSQHCDIWAVGNATMIKITGLPN